MRLAVFSDIHGNLTALETVIADFEAAGGADVIWVLGDLAAIGARPAACIRRIRDWRAAVVGEDETARDRFRVIRGNTDRYLLTGERPRTPIAEDAETWDKNRQNMAALNAAVGWAQAQLSFDEYDFLRKLGHECDRSIDGYGGVFGYHAVPGDDEKNLLPNTPDEEAADLLMDREGRLGIGGHTHRLMDRVLDKAGAPGQPRRVINIGSIGLSFDQPGLAQYAILTFADGEAHLDQRAIPYDVDAALADLNAAGYPEVGLDRLTMLMRYGMPLPVAPPPAPPASA